MFLFYFLISFSMILMPKELLTTIFSLLAVALCYLVQKTLFPRNRSKYVFPLVIYRKGSFKPLGGGGFLNYRGSQGGLIETGLIGEEGLFINQDQGYKNHFFYSLRFWVFI